MNKLSEKKVKEILLIEDNPADVRLMTEVLKDINIEKSEINQFKWVAKEDLLQHFAFPEQRNFFSQVLTDF